jgi:hypothetical protein
VLGKDKRPPKSCAREARDVVVVNKQAGYVIFDACLLVVDVCSSGAQLTSPCSCKHAITPQLITRLSTRLESPIVATWMHITLWAGLKDRTAAPSITVDHIVHLAIHLVPGQLSRPLYLSQKRNFGPAGACESELLGSPASP